MKTTADENQFIYQKILQTKILGNFDHPNQIPNPGFCTFERIWFSSFINRFRVIIFKMYVSVSVFACEYKQ